MLKKAVRGEKLFILLLMHLIHVKKGLKKVTAILYAKSLPYLMEVLFPEEPIW